MEDSGRMGDGESGERGSVRPPNSSEAVTPPNPDPTIIDEDPIHLWFGLSYASYLVLPRAVLQSMPHDWQSRLITLLGEMNDAIDWMPEGCGYDVGMVTAEGRPTIDPNAHYRHRRLPRKK